MRSHFCNRGDVSMDGYIAVKGQTIEKQKRCGGRYIQFKICHCAFRPHLNEKNPRY
jgi:hypothetical protein